MRMAIRPLFAGRFKLCAGGKHAATVEAIPPPGCIFFGTYIQPPQPITKERGRRHSSAPHQCMEVAEAPWSAAEWAVALRFVELLQAQPGH